MNTIMKKHKQFLLLCAAFCMILFLTGCDSMEDRVNISKWQAQASKNALSYLEEKYEFQAKVKKCKCARAAGLFGTSPYSFLSVLLKKKRYLLRIHLSLDIIHSAYYIDKEIKR